MMNLARTSSMIAVVAALSSLSCHREPTPSPPTPRSVDAGAAATPEARRPLRIAYSDWPGWTAFDVGIQKGWFKEAGVDVEFVWLDYLPTMDAFAAGKVDAVMVTNGDALVTGANGAKSQMILVTDYSNGNDQIIARPGVTSFKQLRGKKVGLELTLVEHLLFLKALERFKMRPTDIELMNFPTAETPQALGSGEVDAIAAWYPISAKARRSVVGAKAVFSSADVPGLIYDTVAVTSKSLAERREDWRKIVKVWYRISDYVRDPKTQADSVAIMAAKVGVKASDYAQNISGTYFLTLDEAKKCLRDEDGTGSLYGSSRIADAFNVANKVYKRSQPVAQYIYPDFVLGL